MQNITFPIVQSPTSTARPSSDFLRLRNGSSSTGLGWDIPHDADLEMDQYDNPTAALFACPEERPGGGRGADHAHECAMGQPYLHCCATPTRASWGISRPRLMVGHVASPRVWECTRLVISDSLTTQAERSECLWLIVNGLVHEAEMGGARRR